MGGNEKALLISCSMLIDVEASLRSDPVSVGCNHAQHSHEDAVTAKQLTTTVRPFTYTIFSPFGSTPSLVDVSRDVAGLQAKMDPRNNPQR
jgi:hypothetical protein